MHQSGFWEVKLCTLRDAAPFIHLLCWSMVQEQEKTVHQETQKEGRRMQNTKVQGLATEKYARHKEEQFC